MPPSGRRAPRIGRSTPSLIAIPLAGWAGSSATGIDVMIADRWTVPPLVEASEDAEAFWFRLHDTLTKLLIGLITSTCSAPSSARWRVTEP